MRLLIHFDEAFRDRKESESMDYKTGLTQDNLLVELERVVRGLMQLVYSCSYASQSSSTGLIYEYARTGTLSRISSPPKLVNLANRDEARRCPSTAGYHMNKEMVFVLLG